MTRKRRRFRPPPAAIVPVASAPKPARLLPEQRLLALSEPGAARILIAHWLARYVSLASRRSLYAALRRCSLRPLGLPPESVLWWELTPAEVTGIRLFLVSEFRPSTATQAMSALRGVLKQAWRDGLIDGDQLQRLADQPGIRGTRLPTGRALSIFELERLRAAVSTAAARRDPTSARAGAVLALLYGAGLRRAEAAALPLDSVRSGAFIQVIGKGDKERAVPLPEGAQELLAAWLAVRGAAPGPLICALDRNGRGVRQPIRAVSPEAVWKMVRRMCRAAGVAPVPPHDLRRSYATQLFEMHTDLLSVQTLLGHEDPRTTRRYDRRPDAVRAAAVTKLPVLGDRAKAEQSNADDGAVEEQSASDVGAEGEQE